MVVQNDTMGPSSNAAVCGTMVWWRWREFYMTGTLLTRPGRSTAGTHVDSQLTGRSTGREFYHNITTNSNSTDTTRIIEELRGFFGHKSVQINKELERYVYCHFLLKVEMGRNPFFN